MPGSATSKLTACIDAETATRAAERIGLAYEIGDSIAEFSEDKPELFAAALSIAEVVLVYGLIQAKMTEPQAVSEFAKVFRAARRRMKKLGPDVSLGELLTELHLDQRKR